MNAKTLWNETGKFEHRRMNELRRGHSNRAIARYVQAEKRAGRQGDMNRVCLIGNQLNRACRLYGFTGNPF